MTAPANPSRNAAASAAFRLAAVVLSLYVLAAAAISGGLLWQTNQVLTDQVLTTLKSEAAVLSSEEQSGGTDALIAAVQARSRPEGPGLYFLVGDDGQKLAGNLSRWPPELLNAPNGGVFRYQPASGQTERLGVAIPLSFANGIGLSVGRDIQEQRTYADRVKWVFLTGFGLLSLLSLAGGLWISRSVLKRIDNVNATSQSIMAGDLSRRIPLDGSGDELDGLAQNLNAMLDRIESLMSGLKEVSDNIAHDLKTPLNRLRNAAEAALSDPRGSEAYRDGLEQTIEKADDLIKTFNALLLVARLEAGVLEDNAQAFDAGALVRDVAELYEPAAEEAGFELRTSAATGLWLKANRQLIGQAVANLIDNALKYAADASRSREFRFIDVAISDAADETLISVADKGPGISPEDRERALKRFVRLEKSRTRPGTGLGLSLVAAVARMHGGDVLLEDNAPGLKAILRLPKELRCSRPVNLNPLSEIETSGHDRGIKSGAL